MPLGLGTLSASRSSAPFARSRLWRRFHHKRWHYVSLCTERIFCAVAIVDLGWTSTAFAYAFDRNDGDMLANFSQDGLPGLSARLADHAGGSSRFKTRKSRIAIDGVGDGVVLTGSVSSPAEAQQAFDIASRLVGEPSKVVNGILIRGRDQVLLKVTVAEVQRDIIKQLGVDLSRGKRNAL